MQYTGLRQVLTLTNLIHCIVTCFETLHALPGFSLYCKSFKHKQSNDQSMAMQTKYPAIETMFAGSIPVGEIYYRVFPPLQLDRVLENEMKYALSSVVIVVLDPRND